MVKAYQAPAPRTNKKPNPFHTDAGELPGFW
jgi:hypothetical protein